MHHVDYNELQLGIPFRNIQCIQFRLCISNRVIQFYILNSFPYSLTQIDFSDGDEFIWDLNNCKAGMGRIRTFTLCFYILILNARSGDFPLRSHSNSELQSIGHWMRYLYFWYNSGILRYR